MKKNEFMKHAVKYFGHSYREIATMFGCSRTQVGNALNGLQSSEKCKLIQEWADGLVTEYKAELEKVKCS